MRIIDQRFVNDDSDDKEFLSFDKMRKRDLIIAGRDAWNLKILFFKYVKISMNYIYKFLLYIKTKSTCKRLLSKDSISS